LTSFFESRDIVTIGAVTVDTKTLPGKTFAIKLETFGFFTVTGLERFTRLS
jgi:2-keto-4-pentenoate hydratase